MVLGTKTIHVLTFVLAGLGTRAPILIQMINNPDVKSPQIFFYCGGKREDNPTSLLDCPAKINSLFPSDGSITGTPISVEVHYCKCARISVYDTPGLRSGLCLCSFCSSLCKPFPFSCKSQLAILGDETSNSIIKAVLKERILEDKDVIPVYVQEVNNDWVSHDYNFLDELVHCPGFGNRKIFLVASHFDQ